MTTLRALLDEHHGELLGFMRRKGGRLLRYETAEDLMQGVHARALERGGSFQYRGDEAFRGWLRSVASNYLADRFAYWTALRRRPGRLLRLTNAGTSAPTAGAAAEPPAEATGPITFAERREQLDAAVRALDMMLPRDRDLILAASEGLTVRDLAAYFGLSYDAAEKARARAIERFRKAYRVVSR